MPDDHELERRALPSKEAQRVLARAALLDASTSEALTVRELSEIAAEGGHGGCAPGTRGGGCLGPWLGSMVPSRRAGPSDGASILLDLRGRTVRLATARSLQH